MTEKARKFAKEMHYEECEDCAFHPTRLGCRWRREGTYCDTGKHIAADLIESLSAQLEQVTLERDGLSIMLTSATSAAETYKRERDAAVKDIEELRTRYFRGTCHYCKHHGEEYISNDCMDCHGSNWQWRGVEKEVEGC